MSLIAFGVLGVQLAGCTANRTPDDVRRMTPSPRQFQFARPAPATRNCLLPLLDKLAPFNLQPGLTRPVTVRDLGDKIEIISQDETITLYAVDLVATGKDTSSATAFAPTSHVLGQLEAAARQCGGA